MLRQGIGSIQQTFQAHRAVTLAVASARATSPEVRELWARVMETFVTATASAIESERIRGAAPSGIPARDLAIALNRMNESVLQASFEGDPPAVSSDAVIDTLVEVWYLAIYGTVNDPHV